MFFILQMILTALAAFFNLHVSIVIISLVFILKKFLVGSIFLTCGFPTLIGAATFRGISKQKYTFLLQVIIPLLCITFFTINTIGSFAFIYSFYWFIPVILYFSKNKNLFFASLSSTFVTHAVGSIMWLYSTNTSADKWISLIPVVALERLVAAVGISICFALLNFVYTLKNSELYNYSLFSKSLK